MVIGEVSHLAISESQIINIERVVVHVRIAHEFDADLVEIRQGSGLCGKIVWISKPNDAKGRPQTDTANGNPSLRSRPIVGLQLFEGWRENGPRKWRGTIYDPDRGSNFNVSIALAGDRLVVTGCIVWGCESETWIRYRDQ